MHDIFISYAREDRQRIAPLVRALQDEGFDIWWDDHLVPGDRVFERIEEALNASLCSVVCWSHSALQPERDWIRAEAEMARTRRAAISVLLDDVELPLPFNVAEAVRLVGWTGGRSDTAYCRLVKGIRNSLHAPNRPLYPDTSPSAPPTSVSFSNKPRKVALLIGVRNGGSGDLQLAAADANVRELHKVLVRPGYDFEVKELINPDKQDLERALEQVLTNGENTALLFIYYTGHVLLTPDKNLLLAVSETDLTSHRASTLSLCNFERDYIADSKATQILLAFDACYGRLVDRCCRYDLGQEEIAAAWQACLSSSRSKMVLCTGAGAGSLPAAWEKPNSPLTGRLLTGLVSDEERVDANNDNVITVGELFDYLDTRSNDDMGPMHLLHWDYRTSSVDVAFAGRMRVSSTTLTDEQQTFVAMLAPELKQGNIIPFLGDGIYGTGPLSFFSVAKALARQAGLRADLHSSVGIATAAESLELQCQERGLLLESLQEILTEQASLCRAPAAHELVLDLKPPWFVVTVNYDDLLEKRLEKADRPYVLVTHILRSEPYTDVDSGTGADAPGADQSGKILVVRSQHHPAVLRDPNMAAEICRPQDVKVGENDCVIYRLLGAPFINQLPFAKSRQLDTVVVTETDHIDFLTKLQNPQTGVPRVFASRLFRSKKLLFLEYNLDVWHYRLVGHLFRQGGTGRADSVVTLTKRPYVVRAATSAIEERFWKRFNPDLCAIDLNKLVRAWRAERGRP